MKIQKINSSVLETYGMTSTQFLIQDSLKKLQFFENTFLLANIRTIIDLGILLLSFSNANIRFVEESMKLTWRTYITREMLPTISRVMLIIKNKFIKVTINENFEIFIVYIIVLKARTLIHSTKIAQIAALDWDKTLTKVLAKYADYVNIFSFDLVIKLLENTDINKLSIKLVEDKQPFYGPINVLSLVKLEILKTYIRTYLKPRFIRLSKSLTGIFIIFKKKLYNSLHLFVNYQGLNNFIIKN